MLTIQTTGHDAWDTDARLIDALEGMQVKVNGELVEVIGATDDGHILTHLVKDGKALRAVWPVPADRAIITVL